MNSKQQSPSLSTPDPISGGVTVLLGFGKTHTMMMSAQQNGISYSPIVWGGLTVIEKESLGKDLEMFRPFIHRGLLYIDEYDINDHAANKVVQRLSDTGICVVIASQKAPRIELPTSFHLKVLPMQTEA